MKHLKSHEDHDFSGISKAIDEMKEKEIYIGPIEEDIELELVENENHLRLWRKL